MTINDIALGIPCLQSPDLPSTLLCHDTPRPASPARGGLSGLHSQAPLRAGFCQREGLVGAQSLGRRQEEKEFGASLLQSL